MMNRFLKLVLILSGVASGYLCDAHMMEINNKREMKSIKGLNSLIETDNAGTKAPKKEKGPDQMKGPSVLGKVNDSKGPKTKKRKSKSASYAATFTSSLVIDSSKGTTADDFDKDTTAQDIVGEALKQGLALTSKSHKSPKSNSRKIATYVNSVSFDKASEAISGTTISRVHYNLQALTSDPENAASTVQAEIDSLAAAGTLTDIFNELDTTNTYGFMAASSNVAKVAYRVTVSVGYECTQSIGDGDGVPEALREYHEHLSIVTGQGLTNINIGVDPIIKTSVCKDDVNGRSLNGESRLLRLDQESTVDYILEGECTGQCPDQGIPDIDTTNRRKLEEIKVPESAFLADVLERKTKLGKVDEITFEPGTNGQVGCTDESKCIIYTSPTSTPSTHPSSFPSAAPNATSFPSAAPNNAVSASRYGSELRHNNTECLSQLKNYGNLSSPELCAMAAGEDECGSFMFSSSYTVWGWGCRCCSSPNPNHKDHDLWAVYDVVDCDDPNSECITTATILLDGVRAARDFCADPNPESSAEKYETAARNLSGILSAYTEFIAQDPEMEAAASEAAIIARDVLTPNETGEKCSTEANGCNRGMVLLHQLRNLLALRDLDPFPDSTPHGALFEEHGVLIADGLFFTPGTMEVVHSYFDAVPDHLMIEGVRRDAPFVTMQVKDEFKCNGVAEEIEISVTARGFNVFRVQLGGSTENAFDGTSFPFIGDLLMTVTRHEAAHQFDRFVADDDDLQTMKQTYTSQATADHDWLRSSVGNEYFQQAPQEILASQIGNQYTLSSFNQLALALDRFSAGTSVLPLAWFLLHVDIFSHSPTECTDRACRTRSLFYHSGVAEGGITSTYCVEVGRDLTTGRIISLGLPGCPVLGVTWSDDGDGVGALPVAVQPETWSCEHSLEAGGTVCDAEAPTSTATMTPTYSPIPVSLLYYLWLFMMGYVMG